MIIINLDDNLSNEFFNLMNLNSDNIHDLRFLGNIFYFSNEELFYMIKIEKENLDKLLDLINEDSLLKKLVHEYC